MPPPHDGNLYDVEVFNANLAERTERYRADYRENVLPANYSAKAHFAFIFLGTAACFAFSITQLSAISALEWLAVPLTFIWANIAENLGHRGPMHRPMGVLKRMWKRHGVYHHRFFPSQHMSFDSDKDLHIVFFPWYNALFFFGFFIFPMGVVVALLFTPNVGYLYVMTVMAYYLNYEVLHYAYHAPDGHWIRKVPFVEELRWLHTSHHNPEGMNNVNFNVTYPIADILFGTLDLSLLKAERAARKLPK